MYAFLSKANFKCWNTEFEEAEEEILKTCEWNPYSSLLFALVRIMKGAVFGDDGIRQEGMKRLQSTEKVIKMYRNKNKKNIGELSKKIKELNKGCKMFYPHDPKHADDVMNEIIPEEWKGKIETNIGGQRCYLPLTNDRIYNVSDQLSLDIECIEALRLLYLSGNEFQNGKYLKGAYHMKNCYLLFKKLYQKVKKSTSETQLSTNVEILEHNSAENGDTVKPPQIHPEIRDRIVFGFCFFSFFVQLLPPFFQKILSLVMGSEVFEVDGVHEFKKQKSSTIIGFSFFVLGVHSLFMPSGVMHKEKKMQEFVPILHNFLSHYPESILVDLIVSQFSRKLGNYEMVVKHLEVANQRHLHHSPCSLNQKDAILNLLFDLGNAYFNLRRWDKVIETFQNIISHESQKKKFQFRALVALQCCIAYCGMNDKLNFYSLWKELEEFTVGGNKYTQYVAPYIIRTKKILDSFVMKNQNWVLIKQLFLSLIYFEILYLKRDLDTYKGKAFKDLTKLYFMNTEKMIKIYVNVDKEGLSPKLIHAKFQKMRLQQKQEEDGKEDEKEGIELKKKFEEIVSSTKRSGDWVIPFAMYELGEWWYSKKEYKKAVHYFEKCKGMRKYAFSEVLRARAVISIKQIDRILNKKEEEEEGEEGEREREEKE